jgi:hypothetical protein
MMIMTFVSNTASVWGLIVAKKECQRAKNCSKSDDQNEGRSKRAV